MSARDDCAFEFLRTSAFFSGLNDKDVKFISENSYILSVKKHQHLYYQGDEADQFFIIIKSGWIRLYRTSLDGEEAMAGLLIDLYQKGHVPASSAGG